MSPDRPLHKGIPFRTLTPNAVTALALCIGLSGTWFAIAQNWTLAVLAVVVAGVLDGLDGRIARLLNGQSRFGAELDSLSDVIAFGVSPAVIIYLWSLQYMPQFGWTVALSLVLCCALRLARFNARIDDENRPHKSAGFNTGVPAPAGAGLAFLPLYLWQVTGLEELRHYALVAPWVLVVAFLMISSIATYSWSSLRVRRNIRLEALAFVGLLGAALLTNPWLTLSIIALLYLVMIPFSRASYVRIRRQRAKSAAGSAEPNSAAAPGSAPNRSD